MLHAQGRIPSADVRLPLLGPYCWPVVAVLNAEKHYPFKSYAGEADRGKDEPLQQLRAIRRRQFPRQTQNHIDQVLRVRRAHRQSSQLPRESRPDEGYRTVGSSHHAADNVVRDDARCHVVIDKRIDLGMALIRYGGSEVPPVQSDSPPLMPQTATVVTQLMDGVVNVEGRIEIVSGQDFDQLA
ncbi:hypothetical protein ACP4I1_37010 [Streptomyces sp. WG4]|uniref:hypothetical protein n=1 Tax=Streptomyces sp. WG4 TaxID=3417649 RepID=UPI003CF3AC12